MPGCGKTYTLYIPICFYYHTMQTERDGHNSKSLHSNMFLLSPKTAVCFYQLKNLYIPICFYYHSKTGRKAAIYQIALHSNMFLLSPVSLTGIFTFPAFFTFQYVSIITGKAHRSRHYRSYFTFQYVSIITMKIRMKCGIGYVFTFQYVSIITFCC